jgi:hypothetical protein
LPLILVKPFSGEGEMVISDAPVCLADIPATVASELALPSDFPGISMFAVKETDNRERRYLQYDWEQEFINNEFLPPMKEYCAAGFSWYAESWRMTGKVLAPRPIVYRPGRLWNKIKNLLAEQ